MAMLNSESDNVLSALSNFNNLANFGGSAVKVAAENTIATDAVINGNYRSGSKFGSENLITFANVSGNFANYDKGDVDINGVSAIAGLASAYDNSIFGAFVEYGYADFESSAFDAKTDGESKAKFDAKVAYDAGDFRPYIKAIAEYEFSGKAGFVSEASNESFEISQKGFSGGAGVGFDYNSDGAFSANLGAEQIYGKRDETAAKLRVVFKF